MEGYKSLPAQQKCRLKFTREEPPMSSPGCGQRFLDLSFSEKVYSADEITICDLKLMRHSCSWTNRALRKHKLSATGNSQRCYISKRFQNGTQQMYRFSFSVHLWNYIMMLLPLLVMISSINSVTSYDDLCQNVTWASEIECSCSVNVLNISACEENVTEQNETLYFCPCGNNIVCNINGMYSNGSQIFGNCSCEKGYTGTGLNCELLSTNYCENVTCLNGGTCVELFSNSSYSCNCSSGFSGEHCEQDMNVCNDADFCQNNGSCISEGFGEYVCNCTEGYEGFNCSLPNCTQVECANGGICDILNDKWVCNCTEGFEGFRCESDIDECNSMSPCLNNGSCSNTEGGYYCNCTDGYDGATCSDFNGCLSNPCFQNGSCVHVNETFYYCDCLPGYMGIHCDIRNSCFDYECENGGSCVNLLQNASNSNDDCSIPGNCFFCLCSANFTGSRCETQVTVPDEPQNDLPVALIVGLTVGLFFLLLIIVGVILILVILKKRKNLGTYHPSRQEFANARLEINGGLKPPPEERLI